MSEEFLQHQITEAIQFFDDTENDSEEESYAAGYMDGLDHDEPAPEMFNFPGIYDKGYIDGKGDRALYLLPETCQEGLHRYTAKIDGYGMFATCTDCGVELTKPWIDDILEP